MRNAGARIAYASLILSAGCSAGSPSPEAVGGSSEADTVASSSLTGLGGKCLDVFGGSTADGATVGIWDCHDAAWQDWSYQNETLVGVGGKCLDVSSAGTADGTRVQLYTCNGTVAQVWQFTNGELVNPNSGKCLDVTGNDNADGAVVQLWDCWGGANQQWSLGGTAPSPAPAPSPPTTGGIVGDGKGMTALRIADMMEIFGANVYSNRQDGASGETVAGLTAAAKYITGDSGLVMGFRGYVDSAAEYDSFGPALFAASGGQFTLCMGIGDSPDPTGVDTLAAQAASNGNWIKFIEGGNEPNTNFGEPYQGFVSPDTELSAMKTIDSSVHPTGIPVASPSVVGSYQGIASYWGGDLSSAVSQTDLYNTHLYPNNGGPNGANQLHDWSAGVSNIWGGKPGIITEWQPTLYNNGPTDDATAAYWTPITLLSSFVDFDVRGLYWWDMFDYAGFGGPHVGLFRDNAANPYPAAAALSAMYRLTGDVGATKHSFAPGQLDVTISGLPGGDNAYNGGRSALFQNSSGEYFLFLWNEQNALATGSSSRVTVTFGSAAMTKVVDYSLTNPATATPAPQQTLTDVTQVTVNLTTEVRLLQITYP